MATYKAFNGNRYVEIELNKAFFNNSHRPMYVSIKQTDGYTYNRRVWVDSNGNRYINGKHEATRIIFLEHNCNCEVEYF